MLAVVCRGDVLILPGYPGPSFLARCVAPAPSSSTQTRPIPTPHLRTEPPHQPYHTYPPSYLGTSVLAQVARPESDLRYTRRREATRGDAGRVPQCHVSPAHFPASTVPPSACREPASLPRLALPSHDGPIQRPRSRRRRIAFPTPWPRDAEAAEASATDLESLAVFAVLGSHPNAAPPSSSCGRSSVLQQPCTA